MGATLRVDPAVLRDAAAAQSDVGAFVSGMTTGQSMTTAGAGMSGLLCASACQFVGTVLDAEARAVGAELAAHATNLTAAADRYHQTDEQFARRLDDAVQ